MLTKYIYLASLAIICSLMISSHNEGLPVVHQPQASAAAYETSCRADGPQENEIDLSVIRFEILQVGDIHIKRTINHH